MDAYFGDLNEGTHVIADDVKIHGDSKSTHDLHLLEVLNQCKKIGLKLNADKMYFQSHINSILWTCHFKGRSSTRSCKIGHHKKHAKPFSKHEILSFLGLCNYLSTYVTV